MEKTLKSFKRGMHRSVPPSKTVERAMPLLSRMGITRVANVTGLDRLGVPVFNAYRPNSKSLSVAQGKGATADAAKASAIMEAIEVFHAEEIDMPLQTGSHHALRPDNRLIDVDGLAMLGGTRFDPDVPFPWIEGVDLMQGGSIWLPFELVHTDYTIPKAHDAGCFVASTNGLASGNRPIEAIVHGIYEVIERDAHTLWHLAPAGTKAKSRIDLSTVSDATNASILGKIFDAGMTIAVWDMTSDLGVPTFFCLFTDGRSGGHSGAGAGTHLDRNIALLRAITEAAQVRTNYITGARDDLGLEEYGLAGVEEKNRQARILMSYGGPPYRNFDAGPSHDFETFEADLDFLLDRLALAGVREVVSVDLTRSEFGIPVVRIVIPGLEGPHDHDAYQMGVRARSHLGEARK